MNYPPNSGFASGSLKFLIDKLELKCPFALFSKGETTDFRGYNGSSILGNLSINGVFKINKRYQINFGVWRDCTSWNESRLTLEYNKNTNVIQAKDEKGKVYNSKNL